MVIGMTGCEGTWGTPSLFTIGPLNRSNIKGIAMAHMVCTKFNTKLKNDSTCHGYGTSIQVQFETLHDARPYVAIIQRGYCSSPKDILVRIHLSTNDVQASAGSQGYARLDMPITALLHNGYSAALYDKRVHHSIDQSIGPDNKKCCHYAAFFGRRSKGVFWLIPSSGSDILAWFPPKSHERHDYFRVRRSLPPPGSPYSFAPHLLRFRV